jgi:transcription antitermination protein NusB
MSTEPDGGHETVVEVADADEALAAHRTTWPDDPFSAVDLPTQRRDARERAVTLLYEAEIKSIGGAEVIDSLAIAPEPMVSELVVGVSDTAQVLDEQISAALDSSWSLARLAILDRIVLRIGTYELMYRDQVPTGAAINEAVEMAKLFSGPEAGRFVNGVLSGVSRSVR